MNWPCAQAQRPQNCLCSHSSSKGFDSAAQKFVLILSASGAAATSDTGSALAQTAHLLAQTQIVREVALVAMVYSFAAKQPEPCCRISCQQKYSVTQTGHQTGLTQYCSHFDTAMHTLDHWSWGKLAETQQTNLPF